MRLKRNHYVKQFKPIQTDEWYIENYLPKLSSILDQEQSLLLKICNGEKGEEEKCGS